jgi:hypothetical protein
MTGALTPILDCILSYINVLMAPMGDNPVINAIAPSPSQRDEGYLIGPVQLFETPARHAVRTSGTAAFSSTLGLPLDRCSSAAAVNIRRFRAEGGSGRRHSWFPAWMRAKAELLSLRSVGNWRGHRSNSMSRKLAFLAACPQEAVANFGKQVPMKRPGQPAERATAYVMLADPLSSYVSGATIAVTSGKPIL